MPPFAMINHLRTYSYEYIIKRIICIAACLYNPPILFFSVLTSDTKTLNVAPDTSSSSLT